MPDFTMASAICRIRSSLTLHANLFQLFHPIGGVGARVLTESLLSWARRLALALVKTKIINRIRIALFVRFRFIAIAYASQDGLLMRFASMLWRKSVMCD